jgi:bifunctional UDP-N-acetylglucosamine pyrophosphorylase/glucosamine-1-phosphate N-acetyltransferase
MLAYVLDACREAGVEKMYIVVGYGKEQVIEAFKDDKNIVWVEQAERKGTGHAVLCCKEHLGNFDGETLILCGDGPLIRAETLGTLLAKHESEKAAATLATAVLENPTGYGRIARDAYGNMQGIVEHNDCTPQQLAIQEVNPSYYCFNNKMLFAALANIKPNNVKNEYYLTDAIHLIIAEGHKVVAVTAVPAADALSVNSRAQLSETGKIMQLRIQERLMDNGVTIVDPPNTWIDARAIIGQDTVVEPFTYIHGRVSIGGNCRVGPFAYLREGTSLGDDVVLGVFTEIKNSSLGGGARVRHHSYIGDATVGEKVNIGAGSITANFDGKQVRHTDIGSGSFIGSGSILIAPLSLKSGSHVNPGSVVSQKDAEKLSQGGSR